MLRMRVLSGVTMVTALVIGACTQGTTQTSAAPKAITVVQTAEIKSFDPSASVLFHEINVYSQVFDNLVWFTNDLKPDPKLAASWRNIDPLTWEIKLRANVKFSNGEAMNAESVVESFKYLSRPEAVSRSNLANWESVTRVDDTTVNVKTKVPDPRILTAMIWLYILPTTVLRGDATALGAQPIGTGPFKLVEWIKGDRVVLQANENYWRGKPKIDKVTIKAVPEASARVAALQAGQADIVVNVPPESVDLVNRSANSKVLAATALRNVTIVFDSRTPPFNDVRVRQALNYAVDKESLIKNVLGGRGEIQASTTHALTANHNEALKPYPYDPQKAKELLAQAGFPNGFEIEFHHPTGRWIKDVEVTQAVAGMLEKVGVRSKLSTGEYGNFFTTWSKGEFKGMTMIGTLNLVEPDQVVQLFLYSKGTWPHYSKDPKLDAMYLEELQTMDPAKRSKMLKDMEAYIRDQAPWLFLYFQSDIYGVNKKLKWLAPRNESIVLWDADLEQ